jgi:hypothetical protein
MTPQRNEAGAYSKTTRLVPASTATLRNTSCAGAMVASRPFTFAIHPGKNVSASTT